MEPFLGAWGGRYLHRVYVRAFVYRLFTTVYILYFSARIARRSSRLRQPRRRARRRRCPPPSPTRRDTSQGPKEGPERGEESNVIHVTDLSSMVHDSVV